MGPVVNWSTPPLVPKVVASRCIKARGPGVARSMFSKGTPKSGFYVKFLQFQKLTDNFKVSKQTHTRRANP